ncbi:uncharacterized protein LOC129578864 isoform X2 [Sitodiplosis mosellana]|uniref:uncharacterized protein LOC129578864 isoform X2 n=1 Tax=Sitodiplosis mosellana TaxID=263140 RepID=UPI0024439710|nr:uncharacterized protein LOC129578864 isoform X2 [Sitodiplosis mosellana]
MFAAIVLANSEESIQHVGYTRSCVNMKPVRASAVRREARFTMQHCAKQFNYGRIMEMSASTSARSRLHRKSQHRVQRQKQPEQPQNQQSLLSANAFTTMLHIFCISVFYLCFVNAIPFVAANSVSESGGKNGVNLNTDVPTTTEFDYGNRGIKKFGDKCETTQECGFPGSICDSKKRSCQCVEALPVTNHIDKCGKEASINESCFFNEQCEAFNFLTECRDGRCICRFEMSPIPNKDGTIECKVTRESREPERYVDPAMIGILAGMALMFVIICVVLRLFSRARWRENRTIFNTPNPRLMNVSLLRDNKLMHSQERRGSRMSMRMPSRQPSMVSLRPHSPNPSIGSRRCSRNNSNTSAASTRSNRSGSTAHSLSNRQHVDGKYRVPTTLLETKSSYNSSTDRNGSADINHDPKVTNVTLPISSSSHSSTGMVNI